MTQINTEEFARIVCPPEEQVSMAFLPSSGTGMALMETVFVAGFLVGRLWRNTEAIERAINSRRVNCPHLHAAWGFPSDHPGSRLST
jgi:hypothetical protein